MARFEIDKKGGYVCSQVDEFINTLSIKYEQKLSEQKDRLFSLKNELGVLNNELEKYRLKDSQISKALIVAVEKAEQIETSARKLYDLEVKRLNLLYKRWEELLTDIESEYPHMHKGTYVKSLVDEFKESLNDILNSNGGFNKTNIKDDLKKKSDNYVKNILNKMDYYINTPIARAPKAFKEDENLKEKEKFKTENEKEKNRLNNINNRFTEISCKLPVKEKGEGKVEDFLNSDDDVLLNNAYAKNLANKTIKKAKHFKYPAPNESGFDLQEALNPKEDLDEIMKDFDFFKE